MADFQADVKEKDIHHLEETDSSELGNIEIDPALDRAITRKFDLHIVPWLFGLWLLAFIDRSNIGNARIDGLEDDLQLHGNRFNIALTIFYVPYVCIDVPSNWFLKYIGAGYYLPGLMLGWGLVGMSIGFVKSYEGLLAARFFLGLCEGGLLGGMVLYLSMFYRRHEMIFRLGLFYCAAPLSGAFGGLLATGLAEIRYGGYNRRYLACHFSVLVLTQLGWPWIFIVEGVSFPRMIFGAPRLSLNQSQIITIAFGLVTVFFLPHTPSHSRFLSPEEQIAAVRRMKLDAHGSSKTSKVEHETFSWHWVRIKIHQGSCASVAIYIYINHRSNARSGAHGITQCEHYTTKSELLRNHHTVSAHSLYVGLNSRA